MTFPAERGPKRARDVRLSATAIIWGCATGMLAICLPLTNEPHQGNQGTIVSLAILAAATASSVSVWKYSNKGSQPSLDTSEHIRQLQERIIDLEAIASSDRLDWQRQTEPLTKPELSARPPSNTPEP